METEIFLQKGLDRFWCAKVICPSGKISDRHLNTNTVILRCAHFLARLEGWLHALR
jgi:hypothetical protein